MAYLDSLCVDLMPDVNREMKIRRKPGDQSWESSWARTTAMKKYQIEGVCFVTIRAKGENWESSEKFLEKKRSCKLKIRVGFVNPNQKLKNVQKPAKMKKTIMNTKIGDQVKRVACRDFNRERPKKATKTLTAKGEEKLEYDGRPLERRKSKNRYVEAKRFLDTPTVPFDQPVSMWADPLVVQPLLHIHCKTGKRAETKNSESNAKSKVCILENRTATEQKKKKIENLTIMVRITDKAARGLLTLLTPEKLNSAVGSEEHPASVKEKVAEGPRKGSGKPVKMPGKTEFQKH